MEEFGLSEAQIKGPDFRVAFRRRRAATQKAAEAEPEESMFEAERPEPAIGPAVESKPAGLPVTSPMNGIFYTAPSPSAPPFVKEGVPVEAGQVVGLIEAMKVFNEIVAPVSGMVERVVAETGQLVQPGDVLITISAG